MSPNIQIQAKVASLGRLSTICLHSSESDPPYPNMSTEHWEAQIRAWLTQVSPIIHILAMVPITGRPPYHLYNTIESDLKRTTAYEETPVQLGRQD